MTPQPPRPGEARSEAPWRTLALVALGLVAVVLFVAFGGIKVGDDKSYEIPGLTDSMMCGDGNLSACDRQYERNQ